jgi:hypothetical protein
MAGDKILWGAASMLMKRYGTQAPAKVAERIGALATDGDMHGVRIWQAIAGCMDEMMRSRGIH